MPKWISVKDELPPKGQRVLALERGKVKIVWFGRIWPSHPDMWHNDYGQTMVGAEVTHWMPLPEPPKED